jgi:hypothetical protein
MRWHATASSRDKTVGSALGSGEVGVLGHLVLPHGQSHTLSGDLKAMLAVLSYPGQSSSMPNRINTKIPAPTGWDDFEKVTVSALNLRWKTTELTRYGRSGQAQEGVDIYMVTRDAHIFGIQCKNVDEFSFAEVKESVTKAESFRPLLNTFFIATTAARDAKVQKQVRMLSAGRAKKRRFRVSIIYWDELVSDLLADEDEFRKHFPELAQPMQEVRYNGLTFVEMLGQVAQTQLAREQTLGTDKAVPVVTALLAFETELLDGCGLIPFANGGPRHDFLMHTLMPALHKLGLAEQWRPGVGMMAALMAPYYRLTATGRAFLLRLSVEFDRTSKEQLTMQQFRLGVISQ